MYCILNGIIGKNLRVKVPAFVEGLRHSSSRDNTRSCKRKEVSPEVWTVVSEGQRGGSRGPLGSRRKTEIPKRIRLTKYRHLSVLHHKTRTEESGSQHRRSKYVQHRVQP